MKTFATAFTAIALLAAPAAFASPVDPQEDIIRAVSLLDGVQDGRTRAAVNLLIDQASDAARENSNYQAHVLAERAIEKAERHTAGQSSGAQVSQR